MACFGHVDKFKSLTLQNFIKTLYSHVSCPNHEHAHLVLFPLLHCLFSSHNFEFAFCNLTSTSVGIHANCAGIILGIIGKSIMLEYCQHW